MTSTSDEELILLTRDPDVDDVVVAWRPAEVRRGTKPEMGTTEDSKQTVKDEVRARGDSKRWSSLMVVWSNCVRL
jgi:hypothetical protein